MKETFTVTITRNGHWFEVSVKSNETCRSKYDLALFFPAWTARRLKRQIIKSYKPKKRYKKEYEL